MGKPLGGGDKEKWGEKGLGTVNTASVGWRGGSGV
jgi:hypothetical protein